MDLLRRRKILVGLSSLKEMQNILHLNVALLGVEPTELGRLNLVETSQGVLGSRYRNCRRWIIILLSMAAPALPLFPKRGCVWNGNSFITRSHLKTQAQVCFNRLFTKANGGIRATAHKLMAVIMWHRWKQVNKMEKYTRDAENVLYRSSRYRLHATFLKSFPFGSSLRMLVVVNYSSSQAGGLC